jgi:hypothetical protein
MSRTEWQRARFCGGGGNNCVEVRAENGSVQMRESESPDAVISMPHDRLAALLSGVKAGGIDRLM